MRPISTMVAIVVVLGFIGVAWAADAGPGKPVGTDIIPADRQADWRPGVSVGVPGGIPADRTHLIDVTKEPYNADNTGKTDSSPAIQKAVDDAKAKDVVYLPAGTYRWDKGVTLRAKKNMTIRGAGPDKTVIMLYDKACLFVGSGSEWNWPRHMDVTESAHRGDTVLKLGDSKTLDEYPNGGVGQLCQIRLKNDYTLPVLAPAHWEYLRKQMTRIVAKTPTTVTISPPLLFDLPENLKPQISMASQQAEFDGVEDLKLDGSKGTGAWLLFMEQCYGCWFKNVTALYCLGYHSYLQDILQCEIRQCYIGKRMREGSNGAGIIAGDISNCLVEDNVIVQQFPHIEVNASSGNVFAYNMCYDSSVMELLGCSIDANHGAQSSFNLYEGNLAQRFQSDGYHGSSSQCTAFRNWFYATSDKTDQFWICVNLDRFTRDYNIVGNVLGHKGYTWIYDNCDPGFKGGGYEQHYIYLLGMPGMGNLGFNGQRVQPSKGKMWADWDKMMAAEPGKGPGPNGFGELDLDVAATTIRFGNFNYADNKVPDSESLKGKQLPKSLYLSEKPKWFGNLAWPPFGPDVKFEENKIPAQVRYEAMNK